jgi:hypothetical protein
LQAAQRAALPVLLLGLLFLLPLVAGILPSWLAGRPPLFVTPAAALEDAPGAGFAAAVPPAAVPPPAGAVVPPDEGAPEASAAGAPPLKPLLPPAGLSPAVGVRAASVPVDAEGAAPEPVLPGVLPGPLVPSLPQAPKAKASAMTARLVRGLGKLENGGMAFLLAVVGELGELVQMRATVSELRHTGIRDSISQRGFGNRLFAEGTVSKPLFAVLRLSL